ncbi:nitroreductase family protein [bacterium]|nr:nitroreductase family protein [bacterium]
MQILGAIEKRRAYRALSEAPIEAEVLERIVRAATLAPSCSNNQPWRIVAVTAPDRLEALKAALSSGNYWAKKAPAIAAFVTDLSWDARLEGGRDYALFDLGQAAMAFQLQAVEEGLFVHPIAGFDQAAAKRALGIPDSLILETLIILGHPGDPGSLSEKHQAAERSPRARKPMADVSAADAWNEALIPPPKS